MTGNYNLVKFLLLLLSDRTCFYYVLWEGKSPQNQILFNTFLSRRIQITSDDLRLKSSLTFTYCCHVMLLPSQMFTACIKYIYRTMQLCHTCKLKLQDHDNFPQWLSLHSPLTFTAEHNQLHKEVINSLVILSIVQYNMDSGSFDTSVL